MRGWMSLGVAWGLLAAVTSPAAVRLGSDVLAEQAFRPLQGKRVGLLTNPSGVNREGRWTVDVLRSARGVQLVALFAPEHGLDGKEKAGDKVRGGTDSRTGLPVHSLYGATRKPTPEMLRGLDVLVYDLQDTGTRSYTYISTMGLAMEACAAAGVEFVVLDRPNPLGGVRVEGPMVKDAYRSFIGRWDVPYVYGLTCGELARMINGEGWIQPRCRLTVIPMKGWNRWMSWKATGLSWVATSPNIPDAASVVGYPSLGMLGEISGGSGFSIGGIVARPFQCVTAPWLNADDLARELNRAGLPGVSFRSLSIRRGDAVHRCVNLDFGDPVRAPLVALNFYILQAVRKVSGRDLLKEAEDSGANLAMFDRAAGTDAVRRQLRAGWSATSLVAGWQPGEEAFRKRRRPYLLYSEGETLTPGVAVRGAGDSRSTGSVTTGYVEVLVAQGDTLYAIARTHGTTVDALAQANPEVDPRRLRVGERLRVPRVVKP